MKKKSKRSTLSQENLPKLKNVSTELLRGCRGTSKDGSEARSDPEEARQPQEQEQDCCLEKAVNSCKQEPRCE